MLLKLIPPSSPTGTPSPTIHFSFSFPEELHLPLSHSPSFSSPGSMRRTTREEAGDRRGKEDRKRVFTRWINPSGWCVSWRKSYSISILSGRDTGSHPTLALHPWAGMGGGIGEKGG